MTKSDEKIKKDIIDHIYWDGRVDASNLTVSVERGHITLKVTVTGYFDRKAAFESAFNVPGVSRVENQIIAKITRFIRTSYTLYLTQIFSLISSAISL